MWEIIIGSVSSYVEETMLKGDKALMEWFV